MGKAIRACALVLLLACTASAGTMQYDVYQPPPPPPPTAQSVQEPTVEAQETTAEDETEAPLLAQIVLNLLALL